MLFVSFIQFFMHEYGFIMGGGAARGLAHIGIMRAFYEQNIVPDVIAGTSMGAIIGSLLAIGMHPQEIEEEVKKVTIMSMIDFSFTKAGLLSGEKIFEYLKKFLGVVSFEHLKIPLRICAVDIESGELKVFSKGRVLDAVRASMSIPGIFMPHLLHKHLYIDGGLTDNLPIESLNHFKCKHRIAISVRRSLHQPVLYREYLSKEKEATPAAPAGGMGGMGGMY